MFLPILEKELRYVAYFLQWDNLFSFHRMCLGKVQSQCGCWECSRGCDIGGGTSWGGHWRIVIHWLFLRARDRSVIIYVVNKCERFCLQTPRVRTNVLYVFSSFKWRNDVFITSFVMCCTIPHSRYVVGRNELSQCVRLKPIRYSPVCTEVRSLHHPRECCLN